MKSIREEDRPFTGTQVGALIESFRDELSVFGEKLNTVSEDVAVLKEDVRELKSDMVIVKDILRVEIPRINSRLTRLENKVSLS